MNEKPLPINHITKKTVNQGNIGPIKNIEYRSQKFSHLTLKDEDFKEKDILIIRENGDIDHHFIFKRNNKSWLIPLANPILIYFNSAQSLLRHINMTRENLLSELSENKVNCDEKSMNTFYDFFGSASVFIVQLMTAIEACVNQLIPSDYIYEKQEQNKFVKCYNNEQIQRWVSLNEKVKCILNKVQKRNFSDKNKTKSILIEDLQKLRDDIIHTKIAEGYKAYSELYEKVLKMKFNETIIAVMDFINFYTDDLIEICPCGKDF